MSSTLYVTSTNDGQYKTQITAQKNSLNDQDYQTIEKILNAGQIKKDGNKLLSEDSVENVVKALENSAKYFEESFDQNTNVHQLTPTNWAQGKTPQLRD